MLLMLTAIFTALVEIESRVREVSFQVYERFIADLDISDSEEMIDNEADSTPTFSSLQILY